jgi:hypothetical protein
MRTVTSIFDLRLEGVLNSTFKFTGITKSQTFRSATNELNSPFLSKLEITFLLKINCGTYEFKLQTQFVHCMFDLFQARVDNNSSFDEYIPGLFEIVGQLICESGFS